MKANIDNKALEVRIINPDYNEHAAEVEILEGPHKGAYAIVEKSDLQEEARPKKYKMSDVEYHKGNSMYMGEHSAAWSATVGFGVRRVELAAGCKTKAEARREASTEIKKLNGED